MTLAQEHRRTAINTPLGKDTLVITQLEGVEELSRPFFYTVRMLSETDDLSAEEIVGQNVTITLLDPDDHEHYVNAYVRSFVNHGHGDRACMYTAELVPWVWFLTRRSDCRIFQNLAVPQIVEQVFRDAGLSDFEFANLKGAYPKREYCVQYRETDFDFVSRLLEEEGIFYYFRHEDGRHVLVLGDDPAAYADCKDSKVRFAGPRSFSEVDDNLTAWEHRYEFRSGRVALADFNFETPQQPVRSKERTVLKVPPAANCELYDYPGNFIDRGQGDFRARRAMEAEETDYSRVIGSSKCRGFGPGRKFTVDAHHLTGEEGKTYVITKVHHSVDVGAYMPGGDKPEGYSNDFEAMPAMTPFRPARITPRTLVRGPQTAVVVGPSGEEIYTDKHGRVKVKFHWDRDPKLDENSSCWLRVSQPSVGRGYGTMFIPRIGDEIVVDFLEGDPDRPFVLGRVYNADNTTPYSLPDNKHYSGVKTNSTKGGGGFNEIRFDDTKGAEQLFIHGEYNQDVRIKHDAFEWIGNDRHLIVKNNQLEKVEMDRHATIDRDDVTKVGRDQHLKVAGKQAVGVDGSHSFSVTGDVIEVFKANQSTEVTGSVYIKGMNVVIEAMAGLTIKCGGSSVVVDPAGVTLKGGIVTLDGGMTKINSGPGSPAGSGSAGSAVAAMAATAPEEADVADPGKVAEIKQRQKEEGQGKYGATPAPQFKPKEFEKDKTKTSWIEIQMVDEADQPTPGVKYEIKLPDGSVTSGTLDEKGVARVDGIDPGTCQITFPELDAKAWERLA